MPSRMVEVSRAMPARVDPGVGGAGQAARRRPSTGSGRSGRRRRSPGTRPSGPRPDRVVVGGALLGLGEDAQLHRPRSSREGTGRPAGRCGSARRRFSRSTTARSRSPSSSSASPAPTGPPAMATSSLGRSRPEVDRSRTSFRNSVRANMTVASGTPSRKTECRERTKDSRMPCCTSGGKVWSWAGLIEKLPLTWIPTSRRPGDQIGDPVAQPGDEHRTEQRRAERPAEGAEEGHRRGGRPHLGRRARRSGRPAP